MSDAQWKIIKPLLPPPNTVGRPREADLRRVVNGIFYVTKTGTQWRHLPPCYGPWQTCYRYYRQFIDAGVWNKVTRRCEPRFGVVLNARTYRQLARLTVKTSRVRPCLRRGYDAGKKINGIKRHILVDTMGMLMVVLVTTACVQDRDGARLLLGLMTDACRNLRRIWVDGAYRGELIAWALAKFGIVIEPVLRSDGTKGFKVLPRRWVVERTFAWLDWNRRLSKHYEVLPECAQAFVHIAMIRLTLNRLA
jgi:putative transposase